MEDEQCFAALAVGGGQARKAVGVLYDRHAKRMLGTLRAWGLSPDDSLDVLQEVFVKLARLEGAGTTVNHPRAYMATALRNCFVDFLRGRDSAINESSLSGSGEEDEESILEKVAGDGPIDAELGFRDCLDRALKAFRAKNADAAQTVYLAVVEELSRQELAEVLGRTYGATREYLSQCMKKFEGLLRQICPDYVPDDGVAAS
jgi:RNA polymerase sigma factor (sigma-70 family)